MEAECGGFILAGCHLLKSRFSEANLFALMSLKISDAFQKSRTYPAIEGK